MKDVQATLDLIDGALEDYLSPDAMRWTPDEDQRAEADADPRVELAQRIEDLYALPRGITLPLQPHTTPPPDRDIIGNIRHLYEQMSPEYQVIAPPSFVEQHGQRPELAGIQVEASSLVPEGQVYVVNRRSLAEAQREALSNFSIGFDTRPLRFADVTDRYRINFPVADAGVFEWSADDTPHASDAVDWFRAAHLSLLLHGNVYIKAPTRNPRMRELHAAYRHRQLARRRRNR